MYEGVTVLDVKVGYYEMFIATFDFVLLYLFIMMVYNLCYLILVLKDKVGKFNLDDYGILLLGDMFVKVFKVKGILLEILEEFLGARKRVKVDFKKVIDLL